MKTPPKVALLVETSNAYARGLLRGIVSYIREHRQWSLYLSEHNRGDQPPGWLAHWNGHGIIARIENNAIAQALRDLTVPIVDVSAARLIPALPWFETVLNRMHHTPLRRCQHVRVWRPTSTVFAGHMNIVRR